MYKQRIHSLRKKNTELLFKRRVDKWKPGCVKTASTLVGRCGFKWHWFTTLHFEWHRKVISATITLSSRGGRHFSSVLLLRSWYQKWLRCLFWKEEGEGRWTAVYNQTILSLSVCAAQLEFFLMLLLWEADLWALLDFKKSLFHAS